MNTSPEKPCLLTIGHSSHSLDDFASLLRIHGVTAVADVRSHPFSRFNGQFNRDVIQKFLARVGVYYVFLGTELGARRGETECYLNGKARYELIARTMLFQQGLNRLRHGLGRQRIALMCAEKDPVTCHRSILVCRHLRGNGARIAHILEDGALEKHEELENRLLQMLDLADGMLFESRDAQIERAYDIQGDRIAYIAANGSPETSDNAEIQNG